MSADLPVYWKLEFRAITKSSEKTRKLGDNVFGNAVRKIVVLGQATKVCEWQNRDGWSRRQGQDTWRHWSRRLIRSRCFDVQDIAAPGDGFQNISAYWAKDAANFSDALRQRVVANSHIGPDSVDKLLFGGHPAGMLNQKAENLEALAPQRNRSRWPLKKGSRAVER
jgi:hypothetical protein